MGDVLTESMSECILKFIDKENSDVPFYVADFADILLKAKYWKKKLPRIKIFFAVKSNNDPMLLKFLVSIGCGFDCASKDEIEDVLSAGADSSDVIFAHPVKPRSHILYAASVLVDLMTFDSEHELRKISATFPLARLVIRIKTPRVPSAFQLSDKFGCEMEEVKHLLEVAKSLHLRVVGVSFHVGSLCRTPEVYATAIKMSREVANIAEEVGYRLTILDIGGGFLGTAETFKTFDEMSYYINQGLEEHFPEEDGVQIIAEPGHFVCASAYLLCAKIIGKNIRKIKESRKNGFQRKEILYFLNVGVNTTFHFLLLRNFKRHGFGMAPLLSRAEAARREVVSCKLWGATCSNMDCVMSEGCVAPEMEEGEHVVFFNMGGYTHSFANRFNGFPLPTFHHVFSELSWYEEPGSLPLENFLKDLKPEQLKAFLEIREWIRSKYAY